MKFKRRRYVSDTVGQLDKFLRIYKIDEANNDGWSNPTETLFHKCWGERIENWTADFDSLIQKDAKEIVQFRIRYRKGIETDMIVVWDGKKYSVIKTLGEDPKENYMYLIIERV